MRGFLLTIVLILTLARATRAQSLIELGLSGEVDTVGGTRVEIEVVVSAGGQPRTVALALHVARSTSAVDIASLLTRRLIAAGARVVSSNEQAAQRTIANVFIEDALSVNARLSRGLSASITVCEEAPAYVRILPPLEVKGGAQITIHASTLQPHQQELGHVAIELEVAAGQDVSSVAQALVNASINKGWLAERQNHDAWRPNVMSDGSLVTGCSIELFGSGADWRIEVELTPKRQDR